MKTASMIFAALVFSAAPALADELIVHHDGSDMAPPAATSTTVEKRSSSDGCESKTVHKSDDAGDSKTVHKSNCDD